MRYILLIYSQEDEGATAEDLGAVAAGHRTVMEETSRRGLFRAADPLEPTATATTVRVKDGAVLVTDGPFAETKEQLAGYYILDCQDLDEALAWAAKIPTGCRGEAGCVEVRPIREIRRPIHAESLT
ncbi:MAG TPA: YciI family protein [Bryobacteraceae bacterium]|nr:YciI family protein [Bryobacteraceae bacterium]